MVTARLRVVVLAAPLAFVAEPPRPASAALATIPERVELQLVSATVDGAPVDDTPLARQRADLQAPATVDMGTAGTFVYSPVQ